MNFVIGLPHTSAVECKFKDLNQLWIIQTLCKWHTITPGNPRHELTGYSILICNPNYYSRFSTSLLTHLYKEKASADLPWFNSESPRFSARRKQNLSDKKQVSKVWQISCIYFVENVEKYVVKCFPEDRRRSGSSFSFISICRNCKIHWSKSTSPWKIQPYWIILILISQELSILS